jgi:beta-lactamase regulating signal transducer with metallopeptidase domain
MSAFLASLIEMNLAGVAAVLLVLAARGVAARRLGAHAAYLLWSAVPAAMLATLLPSRTVTVATPGLLPDDIWSTASSPMIVSILLGAWAIGAAIAAAVMIRRQQLFFEDVRRGVAGPAVVGFLDPQVVLPSDFNARFTLAEQRLILVHEDVHLERHDTRINTLVAAARCLFWFNPLVHVAARVMRIDQEASCDAAVVDRRPIQRRAYAETLLKSQLASAALPAGCYWPSDPSHPLTERIALIARRPLSAGRKGIAAGAVTGLAVLCGAAAWAAQPAREVKAPAPAPTLAGAPASGELLVSFEFSPAPPGETGPDTAPPPLRVRLLSDPAPSAL